MSIFMVILCVSVGFLGLACTVFIWCVRNNQYDDVERSGQDIFFDQYDVKCQGEADDN